MSYPIINLFSFNLNLYQGAHSLFGSLLADAKMIIREFPENALHCSHSCNSATA